MYVGKRIPQGRVTSIPDFMLEQAGCAVRDD